MTFLYGIAAIVGGLWLTVYCVNTVKDPFWSAETRRMAWIGLAVGTFVMLSGIAGVTL